MVLKIVARRFGDIDVALTERLDAITDPGQLDLLAVADLTAASFDAFLQVLAGEDHS